MIVRGYFNVTDGLGFQVVALFFQSSDTDEKSALPKAENELAHRVDIIAAIETRPGHDLYYMIHKNRPNLPEDLIIERFKLFFAALYQEMEKF